MTSVFFFLQTTYGSLQTLVNTIVWYANYSTKRHIQLRQQTGGYNNGGFPLQGKYYLHVCRQILPNISLPQGDINLLELGLSQTIDNRQTTCFSSVSAPQTLILEHTRFQMQQSQKQNKTFSYECNICENQQQHKRETWGHTFSKLSFPPLALCPTPHGLVEA